MPLKVPSEVRALVIRDWLSGKPRDTIAHDNVVSFGAVSNIVNEWRHALAVSDGDALRELGMFRKLGITAPQCAVGFRLANILRDLGVDEENFETLFLRFIINARIPVSNQSISLIT
ncbi:MAG TPA: hypothetical protein VE971_02905 [Candidatus Eisenbacteria bacterium]|nr:hypothetical protein [Candidatus Eisenbacteria bacterium]